MRIKENILTMAIALGEGLKKLGIELYSNENYWRIEPNKEKYLFRHDPEVCPEDCSIVILNHEWFWPAKKKHSRKLISFR